MRRELNGFFCNKMVRSSQRESRSRIPGPGGLSIAVGILGLALAEARPALGSGASAGHLWGRAGRGATGGWRELRGRGGGDGFSWALRTRSRESGTSDVRAAGAASLSVVRISAGSLGPLSRPASSAVLRPGPALPAVRAPSLSLSSPGRGVLVDVGHGSRFVAAGARSGPTGPTGVLAAAAGGLEAHYAGEASGPRGLVALASAGGNGAFRAEWRREPPGRSWRVRAGRPDDPARLEAGKERGESGHRSWIAASLEAPAGRRDVASGALTLESGWAESRAGGGRPERESRLAVEWVGRTIRGGTTWRVRAARLARVRSASSEAIGVRATGRMGRGVTIESAIDVGTRRVVAGTLRFARRGGRGAVRLELEERRGRRLELWGGLPLGSRGRARFRLRLARGERPRAEVEWGGRLPALPPTEPGVSLDRSGSVADP
jgi:hypothetical protein